MWATLFAREKSASSRRTRLVRRPHKTTVEGLEDRRLLANFSIAGGNLNLDLSDLNSSVALIAGATNYTLTLTGGTWSGTNSGSVTGNGTNTLTVTKDAFPLINVTDSNSGISVTFNDSGANTYTDDWSIVLDAAAASSISFNGATPFATTSNLSATTTKSLLVNSGASVSAVAGTIGLTSTAQNISLASGASLTTATGAITLSANSGGTGTPNFTGINVNSATITSTSGPISLTGRGGSGGTINHGILVNGATALVSTGGAGTVTLLGFGGAESTFANNEGVQITNSATVQTTGNGLVSVQGTGGSGNVTANYGVSLRNLGKISSTSGAIQVIGTGGSAGAGDSGGVRLSDGGLITGAAAVTVTGTGGGAGANNNGIRMFSGTPSISSSGGIVTLTGTAGGAASNAIQLENSASVSGTGASTVVLIGDSMLIAATTSITSAATSVTLKQKTAALDINLGGADVTSPPPLSLGLTDGELDRVTAPTIFIGDTNTGNITVSAVIDRTAATNLSLTAGSGKNIAFQWRCQSEFQRRQCDVER